MESDLIALYAAEVKQQQWNKSRTDATRNAAVVILFGMIAVSFGFDEVTSHRVPYFGSLAVFVLVLFEARLFRDGVANEKRVQWLEKVFVPSLFDQGVGNDGKQHEQFSALYSHPPRPSFLEAIAHRIHQNYFLIFLALDTSWLSKVYLSPRPARSFAEMVHRLDLGFFSGWITMAFMGIFWIAFITALIYITKAKKQKNI